MRATRQQRTAPRDAAAGSQEHARVLGLLAAAGSTHQVALKGLVDGHAVHVGVIHKPGRKQGGKQKGLWKDAKGKHAALVVRLAALPSTGMQPSTQRAEGDAARQHGGTARQAPSPDDLVGEELAIVLAGQVRLGGLRGVELQRLAHALAQHVHRWVGLHDLGQRLRRRGLCGSREFACLRGVSSHEHASNLQDPDKLQHTSPQRMNWACLDDQRLAAREPVAKGGVQVVRQVDANHDACEAWVGAPWVRQRLRKAQSPHRSSPPTKFSPMATARSRTGRPRAYPQPTRGGGVDGHVVCGVVQELGACVPLNIVAVVVAPAQLRGWQV